MIKTLNEFQCFIFTYKYVIDPITNLIFLIIKITDYLKFITYGYCNIVDLMKY